MQQNYYGSFTHIIRAVDSTSKSLSSLPLSPTRKMSSSKSFFMLAGLVTLVVLATSIGVSARGHKYTVKHDIEYAPKVAPVFHKSYDITENLWKGESSELGINPHFQTLDRRPRYFHSFAAAENQEVFLVFMLHASILWIWYTFLASYVSCNVSWHDRARHIFFHDDALPPSQTLISALSRHTGVVVEVETLENILRLFFHPFSGCRWGRCCWQRIWKLNGNRLLQWIRLSCHATWYMPIEHLNFFKIRIWSSCVEYEQTETSWWSLLCGTL